MAGLDSADTVVAAMDWVDTGVAMDMAADTVMDAVSDTVTVVACSATAMDVGLAMVCRCSDMGSDFGEA